MKTNHTSKNGRFICDTTDIENDGCSIELNPVHYGNHVKGSKIGFVTYDLGFALDTDGDQIPIDVAEIKELMDFIEQLFKSISGITE